MKTEVTAFKNGVYKDINLPASYSQIEDTLQILSSDGEITAKGAYWDEFSACTYTFEYHDCNLFEINYLAEILKRFDDEQASKFIGASYILFKEDANLKDALNLAMNITQNNKVNFQPARDEQDLATFYLENNLIVELEDVKDDAYQWIIDHTNLVELGEEICERENGTFKSSYYVTVSDGLDKLYDDSFRMPIKEEYAFKFEVGLKNERDNRMRKAIALPYPSIEFKKILFDLKASNLSELTSYKFESTIPILEYIDFDMEDIEMLNQLATSIQYFKEVDEFSTYKAMIDALKSIDLETVIKLCDYISEFTLVEKAKTYAEYGRSKFQNVLPDELLECLNTEDYGRKLAEKNGVTLTAYGSLVPKDGVPLLEKMKKSEQKQDFEMSME